MSYDNSANAVRRLEERFERLLLILGDLQAAVGRLQQPSYNPGGPQQGGGGGTVWSIAAQVIAAGGSVSGQTVSTMVSGLLATVTTTGVVYNHSGAATSATAGEIYVGLNTDGTYRVIAQACS